MVICALEDEGIRFLGMAKAPSHGMEQRPAQRPAGAHAKAFALPCRKRNAARRCLPNRPSSGMGGRTCPA